MYLRTPKRYQKQRRHVLGSTRWLWLWILTPLVVVAGVLLYQRREEFAPPVQQFITDAMHNAGSGFATVTAPTPQPTTRPDDRLAAADGAWQQGAIDEAVRTYEGVVDNAPNDVVAHYRLALGLLMEGKTTEALTAADDTITANPFSSDAWAIRAHVLNAVGRQGESIADAMQALQIQKDSTRAKAFLAEAYLDSNQVERARTTVQDALKTDPQNFEALYVYGRILESVDYDFKGALDTYQQAYDQAPNMHYIGVALAWMELQLEEPDKGLEILQHIAEVSPMNTDALDALARFSYTVYGDPNQALDYLNRCIAAQPNHLDCNYFTGTVNFGLGNNEKAAQAFMRVIDIGTTNPRHYLSAGRINASMNNCRVAIPLLQQGYALEEASAAPDQTRLNDFTDAMQGCGTSLNAVNGGDTTPEATVEATLEAGS